MERMLQMKNEGVLVHFEVTLLLREVYYALVSFKHKREAALTK